MQKVVINVLLLFSILAISCASSQPIATEFKPTETTAQPTVASQQIFDETSIPVDTATSVSNEIASNESGDKSVATGEINENSYDVNWNKDMGL